MEHIIKLLPDHIANQIAAGEVVQRPASVVKELLENAIDAGATDIELRIEDAGKTLIQVVDNGTGMLAQDARMAFERHATSKISGSEDLFNIRTLGFRGEALASIAAVAQVSLKTRIPDAELGTEVRIEASQVRSQEPCNCAIGTSIAVKNLFFNVPARRNFLKTNPVETRHIVNEFNRVALANPKLKLSLVHNGTKVYNLGPGDLEARIKELVGKELEGHLIHISESTPYIGISGFIGDPEAARKARGDQYFFVNERFIKSGYLHHAVNSAFKELIPSDKYPFYCIFLNIDPKHVDINIHPTKTEVKFDDEKTVYSLLHSVVRKGLGEIRFEFEEKGGSEMERIIRETPVYNDTRPTIGQMYKPSAKMPQKQDPKAWEELYLPVSKAFPKQEKQPTLPLEGLEEHQRTAPAHLQEGWLVQIQNQFLMTQVKSGLVVIDQCYAHQRILFERFRDAAKRPPLASQQLLFPKSLSFAPGDFSFLKSVMKELNHLGFELREFGPNTFILHGVPSELSNAKVESFFEDFIAENRATEIAEIKGKVYEKLSLSIAMNSAIQPGKSLNQEEMRLLVDQLFGCKHPAVSPTGKPTYYLLETSALHQHFQRRQS